MLFVFASILEYAVSDYTALDVIVAGVNEDVRVFREFCDGLEPSSNSCSFFLSEVSWHPLVVEDRVASSFLIISDGVQVSKCWNYYYSSVPIGDIVWHAFVMHFLRGFFFIESGGNPKCCVGLLSNDERVPVLTQFKLLGSSVFHSSSIYETKRV